MICPLVVVLVDSDLTNSRERCDETSFEAANERPKGRSAESARFSPGKHNLNPGHGRKSKAMVTMGEYCLHGLIDFRNQMKLGESRSSHINLLGGL